MNLMNEDIKNEYRKLLNEDPVPLKNDPAAVQETPPPAPETAPVAEVPAEPVPESEPVPEAVPATEKTRDIQSKVIAILSTKLTGDIKDKLYELKFILKKTKDPQAFDLISSINADIKEINAKILNTFNR